MDAEESTSARVHVDSYTYKQLIILIHQFLAEENFEESLHLFEQESRIYFNLRYFGDVIVNGEWEKAENYLSAFTRTGDSFLSREIFHRMRKQKCLETMLRNNLAEAETFLQKDLSLLSASAADHYGEFTKVHFSGSIRNDEKLSWHISVHTRANLQSDLKKLIEENPIFQDKLSLPKLNASGLFSIMCLIHTCPEKETSIKEELIYLILQFLDEEKFMLTRHKLEQETKMFFNLNHFGKLIIDGEWYEAEKYLSAFTKLDDQYPLQRIFKIRDGRHLEAFDGKSDYLSNFTDPSSVRADLIDGRNQLISKYPILQYKVKFPCMNKSRLLTIIKQTMDWWFLHHTEARANPDNRTFSLATVPRVPYLCYGPSVPISSSSLETGESSSPWTCGSNDASCMTDANSGFSLKRTEKSELQVTKNCSSQKEMEIGSNDQIDQNCGVGIKSSTDIVEINEPSQCCMLVLPDDSLFARVARLNYTCSGDFILALAQNAVHKLWLLHDDKCLSGKALTDIQPSLHQPSNGQAMTNYASENQKDVDHCFALKDHHLLSASGGRISRYNLKTLETVDTFAVPPPVATYFIFLSQEIFAIAFDDSRILIYCTCTKKVKAELQGHQKTTCLAFSQSLNVLASSGTDAQLCVWDAAGWKKRASKTLYSLHTGQVPNPPVVNYIEFHKDQAHLLIVNERQIDIYEAPMLNHFMQRVLPESDPPITYATYSCDGQSIFVSFKNGCIKILSSEALEVRCRISLSAYAQPNPSLEVYPTVVAAHPYKPNQIALGLTDGRVVLLEPLASEGGWRKEGRTSCS
ncbi:topless-related protein 4 [Neltuma alba]|uniref:topless-related protein 4 n=1 Tax=Neltuma alba TaxID=207710 RepID=UPI0010A47F8E|nr:topless-related protein 4 [Prosopis alba]